jgi:glycosyltransferase involved in cell wall biosynthesis
MPVLRIRGPARQAGITVIQGNQGAKISVEKVSEADVVVIQRDFPRFPAYDEVIRRARAEKKLVIYEIDDLILEVPSWHVSHPAFIDVLFRILRGIVEADAVITSTGRLKEYYSAFNPNVWLAPNLLDDTLWPLKPPKAVESHVKPVAVGYMGGASHLPDLEMVKPALKKVMDQYGAQVSFRFWGVKPPPDLLERPSVEWTGLDMLDYAAFARFFSGQDCDIFIAPLLDNTFNRCKSEIKFLEYSSMGIPGVYSRLEPYESVIKDGENGLLAVSLTDWETNLTRLIETPELRFNIGSNAQEMIRQKWLLSKNYHTWLEIYEQGWQNPYLLDPNRTQPVLQFLRIAEQVQGRQEELQMRIVQLAQANGLGTTIANGRLWETIQKARILYRKIRLKAGLN